MDPKLSLSESESTDVVIVGAGPIGIELAVALTKKGIGYQILEAGCLGQTISWWAPQTKWFSSNDRISIAGHPLVTPDGAKATREQFLAYLRSVVMQYDVRVRSQHPVVAIDPIAEAMNDGHRFAVTARTIAGPSVVTCRHVVLAIGGTDHPNRLGIEGEDLPHVDGYLREPHRYHGRDVLIVGGRNSAVEAALRLHAAGARVHLSYQQPVLPEESIKYWLLPELQGLMKSGRIQAHLNTQPTRITARHTFLRQLDRSNADPIRVPADDVLTLIGYRQDKSLFRAAGVKTTGETERPVFDETTMQSNVPGIYVAGTAVAGTQNSKFKTFLENCHVHVDRIVADLTGEAPGQVDATFAQQILVQPES